ncbi:major histocompatibility complex class I-related gene protein-like isoform X2 [Channa argus]|uniref:major histocompatibility complex class I-related gene protein-like isoform X2 n=1 Tax=Channa argus TaxID=215402 RepID=UPI00352224B4
MKSLFLLLLFCHVSSPVKNSLKFVYIVSSGVTNHPEFLGNLLVDDNQVGYCASNKKPEVKDVWKKLFEDKPQLLKDYTQICLERLPTRLKTRLHRFMQHFNQSGGIHILQLIEGCEVDEITKERNGFLNYGYDGEDFISLDLTMRMWIPLNPEADTIKQEWDPDNGRIKSNDRVLTELCPVWLEMYLDYGKSFLLRTVRPSVSLLQKSPSSPVSCHATSFYPDRATMFWRKDGQELHEDMDHGEILPNHDGTFQMRVDLDISSVKPEDWRRYDCVFQLSGAENSTVIRLDKAVIRTNWVSPVGAVVGVVVGLMLLLSLCIGGLVVWRLKENGSQ